MGGLGDMSTLATLGHTADTDAIYSSGQTRSS